MTLVVSDRFGSGVYVMAAPAHPGWGVKLGATWSSSVVSRARNVAGELPVDVVALAYEPMDSPDAARDCEQVLHRRFAADRWRGEWFHLGVPEVSWSEWLRDQVAWFKFLRLVESVCDSLDSQGMDATAAALGRTPEVLRSDLEALGCKLLAAEMAAGAR